MSAGSAVSPSRVTLQPAQCTSRSTALIPEVMRGNLLGLYDCMRDPDALRKCCAVQVIMTSDLPHCSLPNNGSHVRRAYMPQFSAKPIHDQSGVPLALAVPILGLDI